jgi:tRNA pseudouridine synthase 10
VLEQLTIKLIEFLKKNYLCDYCLGRTVANLLSGVTNETRGKVLRYCLAFLFDSGVKIDINSSNFYGIKFRNAKVAAQKPEECAVCKNFFSKEIDKLVETVVKKTRGIEFSTFLIGTKIPPEIQKAEETLWETIGVEFVESIKSEINRELGKRVEKFTKKKFSLTNPDITVLVDIGTGNVRLQLRSIFVAGEYQKLVRNIPQTKWLCPRCRGKGCTYCKGEGKLYKTSIQEIIEKPLLKATKAKKSVFHGHGREDIDARCLAFRPFVIELKNPLRRKINLKEIAKKINVSKKVKVAKLRFTDKNFVRKIKHEKYDKTYRAEIEFMQTLDKKNLKRLKSLEGAVIEQKTPLRVLHRRSDLIRKRKVKKISWKILGKKKLLAKIRSEAGLYVKELITGDGGRTKPNFEELLNNKVKKISLDVVKIHK